MQKSKKYVIIVAAGSGTRFGSSVPKQFCILAGRPVLAHTVDCFLRALPEGEIILVLSPDMIDFWEEQCRACGLQSPRIVAGGASRWESVKNGLAAIGDAKGSEIVLIHDGARPLVDAATIRRAASAALNTDGAIPAVAVTDSLRRIDESGSGSVAVDRNEFRAVQTPQAFTLWRLREAYKLPYSPAFTDDASVMAEAGFVNMVLVEGSPDNIKITNPADLIVAEALLAMGHVDGGSASDDKK